MKRKSKAQLKRDIRAAIDEANWRMFEYENLVDDTGVEMNPMFLEEFQRLYTTGLSGVEKTDFGMRLKPAFYTKIGGKLKDYEQLEIQYNELRDFIEMDIYSPVAKQEYDAITETKYQTFLQNTNMDESNFTRADWESLFSAFEILQKKHKEYAYEDREAANSYRNMYMKLDREKRRTFGSVMEQALKNVSADKNKVKDARSIIDEAERLFGLTDNLEF